MLSDLNVIHFTYQGDSIIRYYEITDDKPYMHYLALYNSKDPQKGIAMQSKRALDVNKNEISRLVA